MAAGKHASVKPKDNFIKVFSYIFPLVAAVIASVFIIKTASAGISIDVFADGREVGYVTDVGEYEEVKTKLEKDMSGVLEVSYKYHPREELVLGFGKSHSDLNKDKLYQGLYVACRDEVTDAYALEIDGTLIAANTDKAVITSALKRVCALMSEKYGCEVEIANDVTISERPVSNRIIMGENAIFTTLCGSSALVDENGEGTEPNSGVSVMNNKKILGRRIFIKKSDSTIENTYYIPADFSEDITASLVYRSTVIESYTETVPFKTIYEKSNKYYDGMTYVSVDGVLGERKVTARASYINGEEVAREIVSYETVSEPVDKIVLEGTKKKPATAPTGVFIMPLENTELNCGFGWRHIFGGTSFHYGIDLDARYGTTVYASDGGEVVYAEYSGSYGYMVKINHGDKYDSLYAHLSSILVNVGDKVYQGQPIALSGDSGRATGPHLHFEIYEFGERKNPGLFLTSIKPSAILKHSAEEMKKVLANAEYFIK